MHFVNIESEATMTFEMMLPGLIYVHVVWIYYADKIKELVLGFKANLQTAIYCPKQMVTRAEGYSRVLTESLAGDLKHSALN